MQRPDELPIPTPSTPRELARRDFLRWLGVGLAVPATGGLGVGGSSPAAVAALQDPKQDPKQDPEARSDEAVSDLIAEDVAAAFRRAKGFGKPLLIAVIPYGRATDDPEDELKAWKDWAMNDNAGEGWPGMPMHSDLGLRLGRALRYADDETLAAIATTEFVAADAVELQELLERKGLPRGDLLVVEPDGELHVAVEALAPIELADDRENYKRDPKSEQKARELAARFGERLRAGLFGDEQRVARRLAVHDDKIGAAGMEFTHHDDGSERALSRGAPAYLAAAMKVEDPEERARWIARLAAMGRERYVNGGPVGARWASSDGCGASYADGRGPALGIACGMGFVSPVNSRYLAFRIR